MAEFMSRLSAGFQGFISGFRSPGAPMKAVEPQGTPPAQFDYPYGYNINTSPRANESIGFDDLRSLADGYDLLRLAIEKRKNQIEAMDWNIVAIDKKDKEQQKISNEVYRFFKRPDKILPFGRWLRAILEDVLVIDAPAVYVRRTRGGKIYAFELVDGATIKPNIDNTGRRPLPHLPAYQQILSGLPAVDLTTDELFYMPRNQRTHKVYGYGNVEQIIMTVNIAIRRQLYQLGYYTEGNIPETFISCPESWGLQQMMDFQVYWDSLFEKNKNLRRKARFVPHGATPTFSKDNPIKDQYDEWLARIISYCLDLPPTSLVKETNRSVAETAQDTGKAEGVTSLAKYIKEFMDILIQDYMDCPGVEFIWMEEQAQKPLEQAQVNEIYSRLDVLTTDEIREDLGRDPLTDEQKKEITVKRSLMQPQFQPYFAGGRQPALADGDEETDEDLTKIAKTDKKKDAKPLSLSTPRLKAAENKLAQTVNNFFDKVKPDLLAQLSKIYEKNMETLKKADDDRKKKIVAMILDELEFDGWAILFDDAVECLADIAQYGAYRSMAQLGVTDKDITKLVDEDAVKWAEKRAAELVGMKYVDGELIENPDPKWAITTSTREYLRDTVSEAVEGGWSPQKLAKEIRENTEIWKRRSETIARTELAFAHSNGNILGWRQSGVTGKKSLCAQPCENYKGDDPCPYNATVGVIPIDELFPSGDDCPPYHPNCRCAVVPVYLDED